MPSLETIIIVCIAGFALSASPGPSMLYVLSRTLNLNWKAGLASSVGLAIGGVLLAVVAALGLTTLFHASENLYVAVKWVGAAYLCYLGIQIVISSVTRKHSEGSDVSSEHLRNVSYGKVLVQGIWVELLNPKTILFFASFIPQFVDPSLGNVTTQMLILGMLVPLTAIPSDLIVSFSGGVMVNTLRRSTVAHRALDFLAAAVLIGIGAHLVLT